MGKIKWVCFEYPVHTLHSARCYLGHKINLTWDISTLERTKSLPRFSSSMFLKYQCLQVSGDHFFSHPWVIPSTPAHLTITYILNCPKHTSLTCGHPSVLPVYFWFHFTWTERAILTNTNMSKINQSASPLPEMTHGNPNPDLPPQFPILTDFSFCALLLSTIVKT